MVVTGQDGVGKAGLDLLENKVCSWGEGRGTDQRRAHRTRAEPGFNKGISKISHLPGMGLRDVGKGREALHMKEWGHEAPHPSRETSSLSHR